METLGFAEVFRYTGGRVDWATSALPLEGEEAARPRAIDVIRRDVPRCRLDEHLGEVGVRMRRAGWSQAVVVDDAGVVLGLVRDDQLAGDEPAVIESVMTEDPKTMRPSVGLERVGDYIPKGADTILVTTPDGVLLGVLDRRDAERRLGVR